MSGAYGEIEIACPVEKVHTYLKNRYQGEGYRSVSMMARGYVPEIRCNEDQENKRLMFWAAARDSLLDFKISGWRWTYQLTPLDASRTKVAIAYQWSWFLTLVSMFTARHQAANELIETALALEALAMEPR